MDINLETTCRICLKVSATYNIFSSMYNDTKVSYCEMINLMFSMSVSETDGLPAKICHRCYTKLSSIYKFRHLAHRSLNTLLKHFDTFNEKEEKERINDVLKFENFKQEIIQVNNDNIAINGNTFLDFEGCLESDLAVYDIKECSVILEKCEFDNFELPEPPDFQLHDIDDFNHYDDGDCTTSELVDVKDTITQESNETVTAIDKNRVKRKRGRKKKLIPGSKKRKTICPECGKSLINMREHIQTHNINRKKLPCPDCPKIFCTYGARTKHRDRTHFNIRFFCKICQKKYVSEDDHMRLVHSNREKKFTCVHCDKKFLIQGQLDIHMIVHTKERPFKCPQCDKVFRSRGFCNQHVRKDHDMERSHLCQYCSKKFFKIGELNAHIRSHLKEKIYKCKICDKMFASSFTVREHEKKHSGIKKFICDICQSNFFTKGALIAHMISHTKVKEHACKYCGIKFGRTDHRNRHQQTAHEMKLLNTELLRDLEFGGKPRKS